MDSSSSSDSGLRDADAGTSKVQSPEIVIEPATTPSPFDSSTPLLERSPTGSHADPEAQQTPTILSDGNSPPMTWRETGYVVVIVTAVLASFYVPSALETSGLDSLYFTKLTWYSIVVSMVASAFLHSINENDRKREMKIGQTISRGSHIRFGLFILALLYWGTWLAFYGMIWLWAVLRYPGSHQSVLQMNRAWVGFQAKMDTPDALIRLTTCLQNALPDRNATIADITACLKEMGMQDG